MLILGGGSNLVVRDAGWDGLVVQIAIPGVAIDDDGDHAIVSASPASCGTTSSREMVDAGLAGVECLSGIPGLVGATPMQNVGAYGQEVADTIVRVRALDRDDRRGRRRSSRAACGFAYRTSVFKGSDAVGRSSRSQFRLAAHGESMPIKYAELARALGIAEGERAPLARRARHRDRASPRQGHGRRSARSGLAQRRLVLHEPDRRRRHARRARRAAAATSHRRSGRSPTARRSSAPAG